MSMASPAPAERSLGPLLDPARVAVVGASAREGSAGRVVWQNLRGFAGEVVPVTASGAAVDGVAGHRRLTDVAGPVDLAVVVVPAEAVPAVVEDAAEAGVGACVVLSGGFAETGAAGGARQDRVVAIARAAGMPLAGPNCLGVQNWGSGLNASLAAGTAAAGGISVITQSGSYAMALPALSADDGARFAIAYSAGNRADIGDAEVLDFLAHHQPTTVVAALVESIADGPAFLDAAARLAAAGKPLVLAPLGRSAAGARAAASHTAAVASGRRVWADLLREAGAVVARSGQEMLDVARALHDQPRPAGRRVGVVTNSGGTGTELADLLADEGLEVPALSPGPRERLRAELPAYGSPANPVDVTPAWHRFAELYPRAIGELATSGEVDAVVAVLLHRSADAAVAAAVVDEVARLRAAGCVVPVVVCWVGRRDQWPAGAALRAAGIPVFDGPARTASALARALRRGEPSARATPMPAAADLGPGRPPPPAADDPVALAAWLAAAGVPMAAVEVVDAADAAADAAARIGFPVVAKVVHPALSHKSDVGGVRVGLLDAASVRAAAADLLALAPGARVAVQPQLSGVELLVGGIRDDTFGPVVAFGAGGVLVELLDDVAFARAPITPTTAGDLVARSRCAPLLDGHRGRPPTPRAAVVDVLVAVGELMARHPEVAALDLNPVLAGPGGCSAVDARLVRTESDGISPPGAQPAG